MEVFRTLQEMSSEEQDRVKQFGLLMMQSQVMAMQSTGVTAEMAANVLAVALLSTVTAHLDVNLSEVKCLSSEEVPNAFVKSLISDCIEYANQNKEG